MQSRDQYEAQVERQKTLIHIGYHKTATTWLQNTVFQPQHGFAQILDHDALFETFIHPHGLEFDAASAGAQVQKMSAELAAEGLVPAVSLEALSGLPFYGNRESDDYARRLKMACPEAKILITVREQTAILASIYMQYVYRAGTMAPKEFFDEKPFRGYFKFAASSVCYDRLTALYQSLFGAQNVLVLPQEMVARDQANAITLLAQFSGNQTLQRKQWRDVKERGTSYPQFSVPLLRRVNYVRRGAMNQNPICNFGRAADTAYRAVGWLARRLPVKDRKAVKSFVAERFEGRFVEANQNLKKILTHDVDLQGYQGL